MREFTEVSIAEIRGMAKLFGGELVKGVVDVAKRILLLDMELHVDGEQLLLTRGSRQADVWGINLRPELFDSEDFVEFDSTINIRPRQGNRSHGVQDAAVRQRIHEIVR